MEIIKRIMEHWSAIVAAVGILWGLYKTVKAHGAWAALKDVAKAIDIYEGAKQHDKPAAQSVKPSDVVKAVMKQTGHGVVLDRAITAGRDEMVKAVRRTGIEADIVLDKKMRPSGAGLKIKHLF